ncbi:MAG: CPBP family intramembrane metalloprotease [Planctomycetaceae bacterium]|nr:CPBP family intramembrane metalloprotease [Planctomycetaceae bacterium]
MVERGGCVRAGICWPTGDYWVRARRPLAALVFLFPWLILYELGTSELGRIWPGEVRNLADLWMRGGLLRLGFDHAFLLPGLVVLGLIAWHLATRDPWQVRVETLLGMSGESVLFAVLLFGVARLQWWTMGVWQSSMALSSTEAAAARLLGFVGAGVYEEVLFRLCLLPLSWVVLRALGLTSTVSIVGAIVVTSLVFAAAHHVGGSESFGWQVFTFRVLAGSVFAGLFLVRGFGIAVGAHVAYDLLVGSPVGSA